MSFVEKTAVVNGCKIFYWEKNPRKKQAVILLHGFPGSHKGLLEMAKGLSGYRLIIPDLPACGKSQRLDAKHNLENYSEWLNGFLQELSLNKTVLVGHSFGSRLSLFFSSKYPEKVEKLVLITPVVKVEGLIARFVSVEYGVAKFLPENLQKLWLQNRIHFDVGHMIIFKTAGAKKRERLIAADREELQKLNPQVNIELFDEFYRFNLIPIGEKIKNKALVIAGALDEIAPLDSVQEFSQQLQNSDFVVMRRAGHVVVAEKPLTVAKIIKKWLGE